MPVDNSAISQKMAELIEAVDRYGFRKWFAQTDVKNCINILQSLAAKAAAPNCTNPMRVLLYSWVCLMRFKWSQYSHVATGRRSQPSYLYQLLDPLMAPLQQFIAAQASAEDIQEVLEGSRTVKGKLVCVMLLVEQDPKAVNAYAPQLIQWLAGTRHWRQLLPLYNQLLSRLFHPLESNLRQFCEFFNRLVEQEPLERFWNISLTLAAYMLDRALFNDQGSLLIQALRMPSAASPLALTEQDRHFLMLLAPLSRFNLATTIEQVVVTELDYSPCADNPGYQLLTEVLGETSVQDPSNLLHCLFKKYFSVNQQRQLRLLLTEVETALWRPYVTRDMTIPPRPASQVVDAPARDWRSPPASWPEPGSGLAEAVMVQIEERYGLTL